MSVRRSYPPTPTAQRSATPNKLNACIVRFGKDQYMKEKREKKRKMHV
jgi:hypothetical protein